jgi:hypothetical protein
MMFIFFPPDAWYTDSNFLARRSNVSGNLEIKQSTSALNHEE